MIEIKIPKEITEYKEKFLFGLTVRQFFSVAVALAICVPLYIFGKDYLGDDATSWLVILIAVPVFGFGFVKYNGMTFEQLLVVLYRQKWKEPQKRKYIELPVFWNFREEMNANELAKKKEYIKYSKRKAAAAPKAAKSNNKKKVLKIEENKDNKGGKDKKQRKGNRQKALGKAEKKEAEKERKEKG